MIKVVAMDDKRFTHTIYQDLVDGLKTGDLNWTHSIVLLAAKHFPQVDLLLAPPAPPLH